MSDASWFKAWYQEYKILFEFFVVLGVVGILVEISILAYTPYNWFSSPNVKTAVTHNIYKLYVLGDRYQEDITAPLELTDCLIFCTKWKTDVYRLMPCEGWTFRLKHEDRTCHLPGSLCQSIPPQDQPWHWVSGESQDKICYITSFDRRSQIQCYSK